MGSVRGESRVRTCNPRPHLCLFNSPFLAALKVKTKGQKQKTKKQQWCTEKREQSQGNLCECSLFLFLQKEKRDKEKGVGKAGSQEKRGQEGRRGKSCKRTSWAVFLFISFVCVRVVCRCTVLSTSAFGACMSLCAFVNIFGYSCVYFGMCVRVSTAGRRGGSTAGRRCARQSASPPGTG